MNQPTDPRTGTQRKKSLLQKIAMQAMQRKGTPVGKFGRFGTKRGGYAGARGTSGGARMMGAGGAARPFGNLNTLQILGLGANPAARYERSGTAASGPRHGPPRPLPSPLVAEAQMAAEPGPEPDVAVAPGYVSTPAYEAYQAAQVEGPGSYIPPAEPGSTFLAPTDPQPGDPGQGGTATGNPEYNQWAAGMFENMWGFQSSPAPADQLTVGGLIPLGGGVYLDPNTGKIAGGGYAGRMLE